MCVCLREKEARLVTRRASLRGTSKSTPLSAQPAQTKTNPDSTKTLSQRRTVSLGQDQRHGALTCQTITGVRMEGQARLQPQ